MKAINLKELKVGNLICFDSFTELILQVNYEDHYIVTSNLYDVRTKFTFDFLSKNKYTIVNN